MRGIILAGGSGSRLSPCTKVTNKHLLPVFDKPMIYYPLNTLVNAGIKDIMIISGRSHCGHFLEFLGSGEDLGINLTYRVQEKAGGIAQSLGLCENFINGDNMVVILGDNIFEDSFDFSSFKIGAKIFLKEVKDPERFGVAELKGNRIKNIFEKPKNLNNKSGLAVTGLYLYDSTVFDIIKTLKPSQRGEYEITDVNSQYLKNNKLDYESLRGFWSDAGTPESLYKTSEFIRNKQNSLNITLKS